LVNGFGVNMNVKYQSNLDPAISIEMEYTVENLAIIQAKVLEKQLENPGNPVYFDGTISFVEGLENAGID